MGLEGVSNSEVEEVLVQKDNEGYYVNCPWLDGEKIGVHRSCNFVDGGCCKHFLKKVSESDADHIMCGYKSPQIS